MGSLEAGTASLQPYIGREEDGFTKTVAMARPPYIIVLATRTGDSSGHLSAGIAIAIALGVLAILAILYQP